MSVLCLPFGPRADMAPDKIVQTPGLLMMLFDDLTYRQVFLDGRPLPEIRILLGWATRLATGMATRW